MGVNVDKKCKAKKLHLKRHFNFKKCKSVHKRVHRFLLDFFFIYIYLIKKCKSVQKYNAKIKRRNKGENTLCHFLARSCFRLCFSYYDGVVVVLFVISYTFTLFTKAIDFKEEFSQKVLYTFLYTVHFFEFQKGENQEKTFFLKIFLYGGFTLWKA